MTVIPTQPPTSKKAPQRRGPRGVCAAGVCTTAGVVPLAQFAQQQQPPPENNSRGRPLPVLAARVGMAVPMPSPMGGAFTTAHAAADPDGPCDLCCAPRGAGAPPAHHVLRVSGRGCAPVGHGVFCGAECARAAVFRHPAFRHWGDAERFAAYQAMLLDPRPRMSHACALFHDSVYLAGRRSAEEVAQQSQYRVQRASEQRRLQELQPERDARTEMLTSFFKFSADQAASMLQQQQRGK
jgi:hypothetical protein